MVIDFVAVTAFTVIVPLLVGARLYKRMPLPGRYITWLLAAWFIAEGSSYILRVNGYSNWNVYFLLSFAEIVIVTIFYKNVIVDKKAKSTIVWIAWIGLGLVCAEYAISQSPDNTLTMLFECTFFFGMGLYALYEMVILKTSQSYNFLVICLMTFFLGSAIYFSTWRFMKYDESLFRLFGNAHAFLLMGCYSLFTYGLWRLQL